METFKEQEKPSTLETINSTVEQIEEALKTYQDILIQIKHLKLVPDHVENLGDDLAATSLPAVEQFTDNGKVFSDKLKTAEASVKGSQYDLFQALSHLRNITGVYTKEEALNFNPETGIKEK